MEGSYDGTRVVIIDKHSQVGAYELGDGNHANLARCVLHGKAEVKLTVIVKALVYALALVLGAMTLALGGCGGGGGGSSTGGSNSVKIYSVTQVEHVFSTAGLVLLREKKGFFRVPDKGRPRLCGELHSSDFRVEVSVCRHSSDDVLLLRRFPAASGAQFRQFNDPDALLDFLRSRPTIAYIGDNRATVRKIRNAVRLLM